MQLESRMSFQHRLEREGRWKAVCLWMDNWRRDKATTTKMSKQQLRELAWDEAEKVFPPIPIEDQMSEVWIPEDQLQKEHGDPLRDLLWVYEVFAVKSIKPSDAPNNGAWAMLMWARKNREKFFDHLMSKGCTHTASKVVKEVAEKKKTSSPERKPEDPGLKRLNRIFSKATTRAKKRRADDGSQSDGGVRSGAAGPRVPVVRQGPTGSEGESGVAQEDSEGV